MQKSPQKNSNLFTKNCAEEDEEEKDSDSTKPRIHNLKPVQGFRLCLQGRITVVIWLLFHVAIYGYTAHLENYFCASLPLLT